MSLNDVPKFLLKHPTVNDHAVIIKDSSLFILLMLQGVTSYFSVQATTLSEYKSDVIPKLHLTAEDPMWDPISSSYSSNEDSMLDFRGHIVSIVTMARRQITMHVNAKSSSQFASYYVIDATDSMIFGTYLECFVQISLTCTSRRAAVSHIKLAKNWGICLDGAKTMIQSKTQRGIQTIANPALL